MRTPKPCRTCGQQFSDRKKGQRYCSDSCNPNIRTCDRAGCSETFVSYEGKKRFCSRECKREHQAANGWADMKLRVCPTCQADFTPRGPKQQHCRPECKPSWTICAVDGCEAGFDEAKISGKRYCSAHRNHSHSGKGRKQTPEHIMKRMGDGTIRPSAEELALVPILEPLGFEHTGAGTFWRMWQDGSFHNPDFVCHETKTVFEYFGSYWHASDKGQEVTIIEAWRAIGYECIILWTEEREAFFADPAGFIASHEATRVRGVSS